MHLILFSKLVLLCLNLLDWELVGADINYLYSNFLAQSRGSTTALGESKAWSLQT